MAFDFVEWIKRGGALPDCPPLLSALTQTTYSFKGDRLLLEPKELIKVKLGFSPDEMDAAMMTFAEPVEARTANRKRANRSAASDSYSPFAYLDNVTERDSASRG